MRDELSIESLKTKIFSTTTAEYFEEVYSSYVHGNYRSAVVMLWSVVVLDIVQKVQSLKDSYEDNVAINILKEIAILNAKERKSSAWELVIVKSVCDLTDLIDDSEYTNLEYLQRQRHLSAHPVIHSGVKLYVPNKDTTRALIRNALEIVLIKPPVYTDRILETILTDLAENGSNFTDLEALQPYIQTKYLKRITLESKLKLFEKFWKFVMHLDDVNCSENRYHNLKFLIILAWDNPSEIERTIANRIDFYSKIKNESVFVNCLIALLIRVPNVYALLNDDTKILINLGIEKHMDFRIASTYNKGSLQEHYEHIEDIFRKEYCNTYINLKTWALLFERSDSVEMEQRCLRAICLYYSESPNFDDANHAITNVMKFIDKFDIDTYKYFIEISEDNRQTYGRAKAAEDYKRIKDNIAKLDKDFDFSSYTGFNSAVARATIA